MFRNISQENNTIYKITKPGEHVFYFENRTGTIIFDINCEDADVKIYGLCECKNSDEVILNIIQKHSSPNNTSNVLVKSVLTGKSIFNFTGTIQVPQHSVNVEARLTNNNLLLSDTSQVITLPQLEVVPHNTKCTHAATVTPLDENQIDYLITRGITRDAATELLINGFTNEIKKIYKKTD